MTQDVSLSQIFKRIHDELIKGLISKDPICLDYENPNTIFEATVRGEILSNKVFKNGM